MSKYVNIYFSLSEEPVIEQSHKNRSSAKECSTLVSLYMFLNSLKNTYKEIHFW